MKYQALFLIAIVAGQVLAGIPAKQRMRATVTRLQPAISSRAHTDSVSIDFCPTCVSFAGQFINQLLNIILNAGVVGSCSELCQMLEDKVSNSTLVGVVCNLLCDYVGIEAFIKLIEKADLDPIYYCELLRLCPIDDNGDATIKSVTVIPNKFSQGASFKIEVLFTTTNGTGTGELDLQIETVDHIPVGANQLMAPLQPGAYNVTFSATASDSGCDPSQDICEEWLPGNYTADVAICNGMCGSNHPHSQIYDTGNGQFEITGRN